MKAYECTNKDCEFDSLKNAIASGENIKGKLSNGVKYSYDATTGKIKLSYRFCRDCIDTMVDGIKQSWEWICAKLSNMFSKGEK